MDNASRSVETNRRKSKKKGRSAAPPPPAGTNPTTFDKAVKKKKEAIYIEALKTAKSLVYAAPKELQQAILTNSTIPPTLAFFDALVCGLRQYATMDKHTQPSPMPANFLHSKSDAEHVRLGVLGLSPKSRPCWKTNYQETK